MQDKEVENFTPFETQTKISKIVQTWIISRKSIETKAPFL